MPKTALVGAPTNAESPLLADSVEKVGLSDHLNSGTITSEEPTHHLEWFLGPSLTFAVLLLVNHGGQATWETPTKGRVGFNDLVIALQEYWLAIASRFPNVEDIKIIGIDLTKRGGVAATRAIEANHAEGSQIDDE